MTMNSPDGLTELYNFATEGSKEKEQSVKTAELMREVGLKCIGFNGVSTPFSPSLKSPLPTLTIASLSHILEMKIY